MILIKYEKNKMKYSENLKMHVKEQALRNYEELPFEARKLTLPEARERAESNEYFMVVKPFNRLVEKGYLDFDENLSLEKIVKLIKKL